MTIFTVGFTVLAALLHVYIFTLVGVGFLKTEHLTGTALALAGTGSMLGAAIVLVTHDRRMMRAALIQGTLPLLAVVFLLLEYWTGAGVGQPVRLWR